MSHATSLVAVPVERRDGLRFNVKLVETRVLGQAIGSSSKPMSNLDQEKFENGNVVAPSVGLYETEKGTPVGKSANAKGKGKALESKSVSKKRCGASTPDAVL
ncbi:uncharacterized protein PGTG_04908 [Puccinia graminis f. sp. tritici CRL 75-36-700-3]|uniref:Uncharacterized protein n=1 Tax=Puccinia graminis f. sp. tritici (strain CRL 75-36-700-3 / race SCCL) TaxID=418459 RepID=E3K395_PUCGT|nr:uncharacterized protein PGTG_04908 [Puccinia graminis f. sp. tritici CRL 75-36-700-3]EFP78952.2 hypothetical protein PGTG_04908 [Puccinia graminis f. sp. tritici CRL 75-36-700-3]